MTQPKRLQSRFPGACHDCGAHVATGEPILWLRKNTIVCADCDAAGYDDAGRPIGTPATVTDSTPAGDWSAALAWNDKPPAPGESIGINSDTIAPAKPAPAKPAIKSSLFRDTRTGEIVARVPIHELASFQKYTGDKTPGEFDNPPAPNFRECKTCGTKYHHNNLACHGNGFCSEKCAQTDSLLADTAVRIVKTAQADRPQLTATAATLVDMLVTIVNAIDRLTVDECETVAAHCTHLANETASGSRRRAFESLARTIH